MYIFASSVEAAPEGIFEMREIDPLARESWRVIARTIRDDPKYAHLRFDIAVVDKVMISEPERWDSERDASSL